MYQQLTLIGNLGNDPEMRYTPSGVAVTSFSLAVSRSWTGKDGQRQEKTIWFRVSAWDKLAETASQYLTKGRQVFVVGELEELRTFTDKNGTMRVSLDVTAGEIRFLGRPDGARRSRSRTCAFCSRLPGHARRGHPSSMSHLPRRTTLPALDTLRRTLADEVAALPSPPDPAQLRRCRRRCLPWRHCGCRWCSATAGVELEKLAALSEDPARPGGLRGAPLLKTTPLTPERVQALIALLRADDPPAYAVQRWFYVVNETPEAWRTLREGVEPLLDRLPDAARQQVQALDTLVTTAPATSPLTDPHRLRRRAQTTGNDSRRCRGLDRPVPQLEGGAAADPAQCGRL